MGPRAVACFGGANVDFTWSPFEDPSFGTSNPAVRYSSVGGVAANVSRTLAGLGLRSAVIAKAGEDADGDRIQRALAERDVDTSHLLRDASRSTGVYSAILSSDGDLVMGLADMAVHDSFSPAWLPSEDGLGTGWSAWVLDANLPADTLAEIARRCPDDTVLVADSVSRAKAPRLKGILDKVDILFSNDSEITALMDDEDPEWAAIAARRAGATTVVLPRGPMGVVVFGAFGMEVFDPPTGKIASVTGAGDALLAGTVFGHVLGLPIPRAIEFGVRVAGATLSCSEPVVPADELATLAQSLRRGEVEG